MGFKINVDRFGFTKKPEPEKVSRDYAAEYAKSLFEKEAKVRNERDIELHNEIIEEGNARKADKAELEERINGETSLRTAEDAELKEYIENLVHTEETLRKLGLDSIGRDLEQEVAARADEDAAIRGRLNRLTDQERDARIAADDALGKRLDNVYTKAEIDGKIDSIDVDLSDYYTKDEAKALLNNKVDKTLYYYNNPDVIPTDPSYFDITDSGVITVKEQFKNIMRDVNLPYEVAGITVRTIGYEAFYNCPYLSSVNIPMSVTKIESRAFCNTGLTTVYLRDSIERLMPYAFLGCNSLRTVTIQETIREIAYDVFKNCENLSIISFGGSQSQWNALTNDVDIGISDNVKFEFWSNLVTEDVISDISTALDEIIALQVEKGGDSE